MTTATVEETTFVHRAFTRRGGLRPAAAVVRLGGAGVHGALPMTISKPVAGVSSETQRVC